MSYFDKVAIKLQWIALYIRWITTFATHATCSITFTTKKYDEFQGVIATQKIELQGKL
jgi:hypothetical protein